MNRAYNKVFGIGFHKTATSSLDVALARLGFSVTGPNGVGESNISSLIDVFIDELVPKYDAFQDNPWPIVYKRLDEKYPNSKFILTVRDESKWIKSVVKHFGLKVTPMRQWIYGSKFGSPMGNEEHYLKMYRNHNAGVIEYFKKRPNDLLILKITEGDGWDKLCPFLNMAVPSELFPNVNKASARKESTIRRGIAKFKNRIAKLQTG